MKRVTVRVFSRPQKMVFDYVYGRHEGGCDKQIPAAFVRATAHHYSTPYVQCRSKSVFHVTALTEVGKATTVYGNPQRVKNAVPGTRSSGTEAAFEARR